jgi:hypothetical protein
MAERIVGHGLDPETMPENRLEHDPEKLQTFRDHAALKLTQRVLLRFQPLVKSSALLT